MRSAKSRKSASERLLKSKHVPINPRLPLVEDLNEASFRTPESVARRVIVLYNVTARGFGLDYATVLYNVKTAGVWENLSPNERIFIEQAHPSRKQIINATWRVEALWVLLWSLGLIDELAFPTKQAITQFIPRLIPEPGDSLSFIAAALLRNKEAILDETDLIYRLHWAVRDAQLNGEPIPAGIDTDVVQERHHALNWLTCYGYDEWDEVATDT